MTGVEFIFEFIFLMLLIQFNFNFISLYPRRITVEENLVDIFREAEAGGEKGAKGLVVNLVVPQATGATIVM